MTGSWFTPSRSSFSRTVHSDGITAPEQVLGAKNYVGTPKDRIVEKTVPGGHIGLFMGARTLKEDWPEIARLIAVQKV